MPREHFPLIEHGLGLLRKAIAVEDEAALRTLAQSLTDILRNKGSDQEMKEAQSEELDQKMEQTIADLSVSMERQNLEETRVRARISLGRMQAKEETWCRSTCG